MILKKISTLLFLIGFIQFSQSQATIQLSKFAQISVITSGPGDALYEKFGHTAIRVKDPVLSLDLIYNYGIFDLEGADFYVNFTKGYMKYKLARYPFHYALKSNQEQKRWVKEQILNLTDTQKNEFFFFLEKNALPQNASYFYDPFFNNCATKPRDIIKKIVGEDFTFSNDFIEKPSSLRQLMNVEINPNTWGSFGINLALGSELDRKITTEEYLYLPDYLYRALEVSSIVRKENTLLDFEEKEAKSDTISPFLVFTLLLILVSFISYKDFKNNTRTKWLDIVLFSTTGIVGCLLIFLWFFTNHSTAPNNFNILWAFAPNLLLSLFLLKDKVNQWIKNYILLLIILLLLIPIIWISKIQLFTYPMIPLFLLLGIRYLFLYKKL